MNILYISVLASQAVIDRARSTDPTFNSYAVQKFNRLVVNGLSANGTIVTALSSFTNQKNKIWKHKHENINGVEFRYIPSINIGPLRYISVFFYCFFYVLVWGGLKHKDKVLACDVLNASASSGAILAARLINLRCIGVMTDMPNLMMCKIDEENRGWVKKHYSSFTASYLKSFTHYVFLTEKMNEVVNVFNRPYIVMEGLVDSQYKINRQCRTNLDKRIVLYAGGLHERYGLKLLVESFLNIEFPDAELWIYGSGPFEESLKNYENKDSRIHFWGIKPNEEVVEAEMMATLLVNPRPTHEDFTQFSFPSKNMEYMVSGTPVLTTALPGMPEEYYPYIYLFDRGESIEGYTEVLKKVLSFPREELLSKGKNAQKWVLQKKNNIYQTRRIIKLVNENK